MHTTVCCLRPSYTGLYEDHYLTKAGSSANANADNIDFMFLATLDFLMLVTYVCVNQSRQSIRPTCNSFSI